MKVLSSASPSEVKKHNARCETYSGEQLKFRLDLRRFLIAPESKGDPYPRYLVLNHTNFSMTMSPRRDPFHSVVTTIDRSVKQPEVQNCILLVPHKSRAFSQSSSRKCPQIIKRWTQISQFLQESMPALDPPSLPILTPFVFCPRAPCGLSVHLSGIFCTRPSPVCWHCQITDTWQPLEWLHFMG